MPQQRLYYRTIRDAITTTAGDMTAYRLAQLCELPDGTRPVSVNHIRLYLAGEKDMTGAKLDRLMSILGLEISAKSPPNPK